MSPKGRLEDQVALLKTPTAQLASNGGSQHPDKRKAGGHGPTLADEVEHLLPTPVAHDSGNTPESHLRKKPGRSQVTSLKVVAEHGLIETGGLLPTPTTQPATGNGHARNLGREAQLLPTPRAQNGEPRNQNVWERPAGEPLNLENALALLPTPRTVPSAAQRWGRYSAAVARWETLTRPAPDPTVPGKTGRRLNPALVEWMMGLPDGWVTGLIRGKGEPKSSGITANAALRILGNGVVPQQCELAVRMLLPLVERRAPDMPGGG